MKSLDELQAKWFLNVDNPSGFPPQSRHPGALVSPYTDGNRVQPILSGASFMKRFYELAQAMIDDDDPAGHEL